MTAAPTRTRPPRSPTSRSAGTPEMSITTGGRARRRFSIGPSDWPPAISLARPSCWRSHCSACCIDSARKYSNCAAFMLPPRRLAQWPAARGSASAGSAGCATARRRPGRAAHR
ncbi:Uncharacterised protein [Bordetella pertussis]|nr:Uncharacterised protein [Bordetella pertussis]